MRCTYVKAVNYIGIYNGLNTDTLELDLSKSQNNILMLIGVNGSGKTTIADDILCPTVSSLTNPDRKKVILRGKTGYKEIHYKKDDFVSYIIKHMMKPKFDAKTKKDSHEVKSYIMKITSEEANELNPNGNVRSFKEILYNEFEFDANTAKLLSLSSSGNSFIDMTFTDRKKYINEVKDDLSAYANFSAYANSRYKEAKALLMSTVSRLAEIGDIDTLQSQYDTTKANLDKAREDLVHEASKIKVYNQKIVNSRGWQLDERRKELDSSIGRMTSSISVLVDTIDNYRKVFSNVPEDKFNIKGISNYTNILENKIQSLKDQMLSSEDVKRETMNSIEEYKGLLNEKQSKLDQYTDGIDIEDLKAKLVNCDKKIKLYEEAFGNVGELNTDAMIKADSVLSSLRESISTFLSNYSDSDIRDVIWYYDRGIDPISHLSEMKIGFDNDYSTIKTQIYRISDKIKMEEEKLKKGTMSDMRPSNCSINDCPLANDEKLKEIVKESIVKLEGEIDQMNGKKRAVENELKLVGDKLEVAIEWSKILSTFAMHYKVLMQVPDERVEKLVNSDNLLGLMHDGFLIDFHLGTYIEASQMYQEYIMYKDDVRPKLVERVNLYNSRVSIIEEIKSSMEEINRFIKKKKTEMDIAISRINANSRDVAMYESAIPKLKSLESNMREYEGINEERVALVNERDELDETMKETNKYLKLIDQTHVKIEGLENSIENYENTLMSLNHKISSHNEFSERREALELTYRKITVLRTMLSPKTGIPLIFMELYLKETVILANKLLNLVTDGKYELLDFVINDTEFRMPCRKADGEEVEDVKTMSQGEKSIISTCLSFSLAYQASPTFNILTLDEMDGPLDSIYKQRYLHVMEEVMSLFGTEQIVMISHNDAFFNYPVDLILLDGHEKIIKETLPLANIIYQHK